MDMKKTYDTMVKKANEDKSFKKELLSDANSALKKLGVEIPDGVKVEVYQSTDDHIQFVLPVKA